VGRLNFVVMNFVGAKHLFAMQKPINHPSLKASPLRKVLLRQMDADIQGLVASLNSTF